MAILPGRSPRARIREWRAQTRMRKRFESRLDRKVRAELKRDGRDAARAYVARGRAGVASTRAAHKRRVGDILTKHLRAVMRTFGMRVLDELRPRIPKDEDDEFTRLLRDYIARHAGKKVVQITTTTRRQIQIAIEQGVAEGLGQREVAKLITERTSGSIAKARANVIARTETHQASVAAGDAALDASGINKRFMREWIAAKDERTRDTHLAADGKRRAPKEPFDVGGASLLFPGDPGGPPGETINCRCVLGYVPVDVDDE